MLIGPTPTSLEAFGRAVHRIATLPVLLLITFRPEFEPPWIGQPHVTALTINRLTRPEVDAMIDRVAGNKQLPANARQDIIERTDGIPLFVEEMTRVRHHFMGISGVRAGNPTLVPRPGGAKMPADSEFPRTADSRGPRFVGWLTWP